MTKKLRIEFVVEKKEKQTLEEFAFRQRISVSQWLRCAAAMVISNNNGKVELGDITPKSLNIDDRKSLILSLAESGAQKPKTNTSLGGCMLSYIIKSSPVYDKDFHAQLKKIRPDWFLKSVDVNKKMLLNMARSKEHKNKIIEDNVMRRNLSNYTYASSSCYDKEFTEKVRKLAPVWFENRI